MPYSREYKPKVSVIVPIYNVEQHIERCARSLLEQTLDNIEYIFINDCTPDHSMDVLQRVLKQYPEQEKFIRIINHPYNMGAAKARENGIKAATGEYIIHCDSDDWVDLDMYRLLYEKGKAENLEMVICDWFETDGTQHIPIRQDLDIRTDILKGLINRSISGSLCFRMVARCRYMEITEFPKAHMMEDVNYSIQLTIKCKNSIGYLDRPLYYYYRNKQSVCNEPSDESCLRRCKQACININGIISILKLNNLDEKYRHELIVLKNSARVFIWPLYMREPRKYRTIWRSVYPEINNTYPFTQCISRRLRLNFFLANIGFYPYILRLYRWLIRKE